MARGACVAEVVSRWARPATAVALGTLVSGQGWELGCRAAKWKMYSASWWRIALFCDVQLHVRGPWLRFGRLMKCSLLGPELCTAGIAAASRVPEASQGWVEGGVF
jgi:hypothetical protein